MHYMIWRVTGTPPVRNPAPDQNSPADINAGLLLEDILEKVYEDFQELIPYDRISCALLENNGTVVRAQWDIRTSRSSKLIKAIRRCGG